MSAGTGAPLRAEEIGQLKREALALQSIDLRRRDLAMIELLVAGYCGPSRRYFSRADLASLDDPSPAAGDFGWRLPPLLEVATAVAAKTSIDERLALRDSEGALLAILTLEEKWSAADLDNADAAERLRHDHAGGWFLAGSVEPVEAPGHADFLPYRLSADDVREQFAQRGWTRVLACQPAGMIHRAESARVLHAATLAQAEVLIQALVTDDETSTLDHYARIRCLEHVAHHVSKQGALLTILPNPGLVLQRQEVLWRAMLARNAGATHLLVEPEWWHGADVDERMLKASVAREAGIELVDLPHFVRDASTGTFVAASVSESVSDPSREILRMIRESEEVPDWISFPEVVAELRRSHPARGRQGVTVFFTGLSGAGKSTIARVLLSKLLEMGGRTVTLLDGDIVRKHLSSELGFSREHRDINIRRIGYVASEITKHGGIAICAPIAPYRVTRRKVRELVAAHGGFFEVHVATPLETCELRDRKGLYAKARAGLIKEFTGISDPYETPENAEIVIDTRDCTPLDAAQTIIDRLEEEGFLG